LAILYGLILELRQGVEDLQFRLQLTNDKVVLFLQILSSMHEAFLSPLEGATSRQGPEADIAEGEENVHATTKQEPGAATTDGDVRMQRVEELEFKRAGSTTMDEKETARHDLGTETKEKVEG
jgi:hypothetical protein